MKKPNNYWKDENNLKKELEPIIKKNNGEFPTQGYLIENDYSSLNNAIRMHGGFPAVRQKMGYELNIKPDGYWKDFDNIKKGLEPIIEKNNGEFPTSTYLEENCYSSLRYAIQQYHGGLPKVRQKMGYEEENKPNGYWKDESNFERELKIVIKENNGEFPTYEYLSENGYSSLRSAIQMHGGFSAVRGKMGYELNIKPDGYWENWDNFEKELKIAIEENNGEFPTSNYLKENGYSSINNAIQMHGGFPAVRQKMGYEENRKPEGYWNDWSNFEKELKIVIEENNGEFPTFRYLMKNGYSRIGRAIQMHGGFPKVRQKMGYELSIEERVLRLLEET